MKIAFLLGNCSGPLSSLSLAMPRSPWGFLLPSSTLPAHPLTGSLAGAAWVSLGPRPFLLHLSPHGCVFCLQ